MALGTYFDEYIRRKIKEGRYNNASEMLRAPLRLLEDEDNRHTALQSAINEGIDSGICEDFDANKHLEALKSRRANA